MTITWDLFKIVTNATVQTVLNNSMWMTKIHKCSTFLTDSMTLGHNINCSIATSSTKTMGHQKS